MPVETTRVFGCSTKWAEKQADARKSLDRWDAEPVSLATRRPGRRRQARQERYEEAPAREPLGNLVRPVRRRAAGARHDEPDVSQAELSARDHQPRRALRSKTSASKVLKENHVSATNLILSTDDRDKFAEALDQDWPGPVPYTILIAPGGKILYRKTGAIDPLELKRAIVGYLGRTY